MTADGHSLLQRFHDGLSDAQRGAVQAAVAAGRGMGADLYLVGGSVRDLVLGRAAQDVDIAVEGDAEALAEALGPRLAARVVRHGRFGTATLRGDDFHLDLARTRRETYPRPGALPEVEDAGIAEDLARRDFTIAAMALRLTAPEGELLDPFAGRADISRGHIRVLHERSFQDDATRMIRACRYASRLGFMLEARTRSWLERDLAYVDTISAARIRRELALLLQEPSAVKAAELAQGLGVLSAVHPLLSLEPEHAHPWREALEGTALAPATELGLAMIAHPVDDADVASMSERLHPTGRQEAVLRDLVRLRDLSAKLDSPALAPAEAVAALSPMAAAAVWGFGLKRGGRAGEHCLRYLREWRHVRTSLNGDDLLAMGMAPGPEMGRVLDRLKAAKLGAEVETQEDEVALVRREFGNLLQDGA